MRQPYSGPGWELSWTMSFSKVCSTENSAKNSVSLQIHIGPGGWPCSVTEHVQKEEKKLLRVHIYTLKSILAAQRELKNYSIYHYPSRPVHRTTVCMSLTVSNRDRFRPKFPKPRAVALVKVLRGWSSEVCKLHLNSEHAGCCREVTVPGRGLDHDPQAYLQPLSPSCFKFLPCPGH